MYVIKQPLPVASTADSHAQVLSQWNAVYDAYNEVACLILGSMTPELHKQFENSSPYDMIKELKSMFEKQAGEERFNLIQTFHACKQEEGKLVAAYVLQMKGYVDQLERLGHMLPQDLIVGLILNGLTKDFAGFVRNYNMHNMGKTIGELHAMLIEYEKGLPKKAETPQVMIIKGGKIQKANKKSLKAKVKGKANSKGKDKQVYIPKPKNPKPSAKEHPAKDDTCHHCKEVGHWKRNCHVYIAELLKKKKQVGSASSSDDESFDQCVSCLSGKMTRKSFPHRPERATDLLGIIHTDVCGPLRHVSRQGASYFITFTDDYSRYGYVYLLKHKHEVFETFKVFKNKVENQLGKTIKALRSDRGGEYISQEFKDYLKACGIVQQLTPPYTPQHNGVSERRNQSATRILKMVPTKKVDKTPYELWYGKVPNLSYLKVWGCEALVKRDTPDKLQQRSVKCIFIGYPKETMSYYFYFPPENKIVVVRYAEFFEKNLIIQEVSGRAMDLVSIKSPDSAGPGLLRASDRRSEWVSFSDSSNTLPLSVSQEAPPQLAPLLDLSISNSP
ncbi:retrotransposon protein, putative, ty1-copia subclass [Tanacetum coccineum]|uniref:Retrotransposon protein, putative, ty1-copia subclass n=1 Tax=Tanacetum coccineum TaxID=301880 RepID=A0ABQ4XEU4_9ASTR